MNHTEATTKQIEEFERGLAGLPAPLRLAQVAGYCRALALELASDLDTATRPGRHPGLCRVEIRHAESDLAVYYEVDGDDLNLIHAYIDQVDVIHLLDPDNLVEAVIDALEAEARLEAETDAAEIVGPITHAF